MLPLEQVIVMSAAQQLPLGNTDWYYKNLVPKTLKDNMEFREDVLTLGYRHSDFARELWMICSRDPLFFINAFGWTLNPKEFPAQPLRPFITYPYQDEAYKQIADAIGVRDIAIPKTRDMGASWMCLLALEHRFHFLDLQQFLLTSEKDELVDGPSEKSLFSKLDFWWNHLPVWLRPRLSGVKKHRLNLDNGSAFDGEATVDNMATGDRRTAILLDETSKMPGADKIFTSTRDVSRTRIFNSTPNGMLGIGEPFFTKVKNPNTTKVFMHWSQHPDKAKGLYKFVDGVKTPLPASYDWKTDYDFEQLRFVKEKPRSEWYDEQCGRAESEKEIAQELDIDFLGSSEKFADLEVMIKARDTDCAEPLVAGRISVDPEDQKLTFIRTNDGPFQLWCPLVEGRPEKGRFVVGVDISAGTGGDYSSDSALVVWDKSNGTQVGLYCTNTTKPEDFAGVCVGVCKWFHDAFLIPETNGPLGQQFINEVKRVRYWNVYRRQVTHLISNEITKKLGYTNTDGGATVLGALHDAISKGVAKVRSRKVIAQFLEYEWKNGSIFHASAATSDSQADKGKTHGDCAIAAAVGWAMGVKGVKPPDPEVEVEKAIPGTVAYRFQDRERELVTAATDFNW